MLARRADADAQSEWRDADTWLEFGLVPFYADVCVNTTLGGRCTVGQLLAICAHLLPRHRGTLAVPRPRE